MVKLLSEPVNCGFTHTACRLIEGTNLTAKCEETETACTGGAV
jgi:hypothetical protein